MAKDPLIVLRECILNNQDIREEEDQVYLGDTLLPRNALTSFKCSKKGEPEEFYTLDALLFFLKNSSVPHVVYHAKAKVEDVQIVRRLHRKNILKLLTGSADNMTEVTCVEKRRNSSGSETGSTSKKQRTEEIENEEGPPLLHPECTPEPVQTIEEEIPAEDIAEEIELENPKPLSERSRSLSSIDDPRSPSPLPSVCSLGTVDVSTQTDPDNQAATIQAFQVISNRVLKFLEEDIGLTREERESVLEGKKIPPRRFGNRGKQPRCFVAIPHPLFEWDTVKDEASHVVSGQRINRKDTDIENRYQYVLDNCLKRGESDLKDSLSILISHMRDVNKSNLSLPEVEASCKRTLERCLTSAQEDFREMFESLLSVVQESSPDLELQKWMSESETELRKLLNSLMLSLQTLRDVSPTSRTLFHFPEPIVSIALNPTKVTHSVVLEIYVRLGLAELRRILIDMIASIEKARTAKKGKRRQSDGEDLGDDDPEEAATAAAGVGRGAGAEALERPPSASSASASDRGHSPTFASSTLVESIKNDWSADEGDGSSPLKKHTKSRRDADSDTPLRPVVAAAATESMAEKSPSSNNNASEHPVAGETITLMGGGADRYNEFTKSIKSTLVTSFKKRIQEKIEASATTEECISWLRTKKGFKK